MSPTEPHLNEEGIQDPGTDALQDPGTEVSFQDPGTEP